MVGEQVIDVHILHFMEVAVVVAFEGIVDGRIEQFILMTATDGLPLCGHLFAPLLYRRIQGNVGRLLDVAIIEVKALIDKIAHIFQLLLASYKVGIFLRAVAASKEVGDVFCIDTRGTRQLSGTILPLARTQEASQLVQLVNECLALHIAHGVFLAEIAVVVAAKRRYAVFVPVAAYLAREVVRIIAEACLPVVILVEEGRTVVAIEAFVLVVVLTQFTHTGAEAVDAVARESAITVMVGQFTVVPYKLRHANRTCQRVVICDILQMAGRIA